MPRGAVDPFLLAFGRAVKLMREERGLSQERLAQGIGVERTYLADVEGGRRNVTLRNLVRIAAALGVALSDLLAAAERVASDATGERARGSDEQSSAG